MFLWGRGRAGEGSDDGDFPDRREHRLAQRKPRLPRAVQGCHGRAGGLPGARGGACGALTGRVAADRAQRRPLLPRRLPLPLWRARLHPGPAHAPLLAPPPRRARSQGGALAKEGVRG
eukprot:3153649-Rhodomonas_salina.2